MNSFRNRKSHLLIAKTKHLDSNCKSLISFQCKLQKRINFSLSQHFFFETIVATNLVGGFDICQKVEVYTMVFSALSLFTYPAYWLQQLTLYLSHRLLNSKLETIGKKVFVNWGSLQASPSYYIFLCKSWSSFY